MLPFGVQWYQRGRIACGRGGVIFQAAVLRSTWTHSAGELASGKATCLSPSNTATVRHMRPTSISLATLRTVQVVQTCEEVPLPIQLRRKNIPLAALLTVPPETRRTAKAIFQAANIPEPHAKQRPIDASPQTSVPLDCFVPSCLRGKTPAPLCSLASWW